MTDRHLRELTVARSTSTAHRLLHHDGVCSNVHGHNMVWDVVLTIDMGDTGPDNMPVDFKRISDLVDETDHAILLNADDPLLDDPGVTEVLGRVVVLDSDPTTEHLTQWMADRLVQETPKIIRAEVTVRETEKYGMTAVATAEDDGERIGESPP